MYDTVLTLQLAAVSAPPEKDATYKYLAFFYSVWFYAVSDPYVPPAESTKSWAFPQYPWVAEEKIAEYSE
jgi:hypothetical protein